MAGCVVDLGVVPTGAADAPVGASAPFGHVAPSARRVVLVAVVLGLLFGALACAAGMAGGNAHGAHQPGPVAVAPSAVDEHRAHAVRVDADATATALVAATDHLPDSSSGSSMAEGHPGMACVVPVELRFADPSAATLSDLYEVAAAGISPDCAADVDPPIPKFS